MQENLKHTILYDRHIALGATIVEFGGYGMPVMYTDGILKEHLATRKSAGLFDASHMGRFIVGGSNALDFMEPSRKAPFLLQGPFAHVPCQIVTLEKTAERSGILMTCSRVMLGTWFTQSWMPGRNLGFNPRVKGLSMSGLESYRCEQQLDIHLIK